MLRPFCGLIQRWRNPSSATIIVDDEVPYATRMPSPVDARISVVGDRVRDASG
jgi:hypothetical protein